MPPLPLDYIDIPVTRKPRTRLDFGQTAIRKTNGVDPRHKPGLNPAEGSEILGSRASEESRKRYLECVKFSQSAKRRRCQIFSSTPEPEPETVKITSSPQSKIIDAVEMLSTVSELIADGSRDNILPTISGKHRDLNAISPETMCDIVDGVYDDRMDKVTVIDCRYPYEYNGGHIKGAVHLYTKEAILTFLKDSMTSSAQNHVLIFHCEFSSERGPKMYRFLRSLDRDMNKEHYPRLHFPEIYLLEGGYKAFFYTCKEKCVPQSYKPMLHKEHKEELRHFRVKSKSWSAGDRSRRSRDIGSGLKLVF